MKLLNIFKKETSKTRSSNIQKMDKIQLQKVTGGTNADGKITMPIKGGISGTTN